MARKEWPGASFKAPKEQKLDTSPFDEILRQAYGPGIISLFDPPDPRREARRKAIRYRYIRRPHD